MNLTVTIFGNKFLVEGLKLAFMSYNTAGLFVIASLLSDSWPVIIATSIMAGFAAMVANDLVKTAKFKKQ
jgi:hypothetical protein